MNKEQANELAKPSVEGLRKSDSISKLAYALSLAQSEMPEAVFNAKNPFLGNKYADLGAVVKASRPVLTKHKLAISQFPFSSALGVGVVNILVHESGEFLECTVTMPLTEEKGVNVAQVAGKNITYLRRYSWASILGMVSEEDLDGKIAEVNQKVEKIMKERVWSVDAMEEVIHYGGLASTHEEAKELLDFSVMPDTAPVTTIHSWLKRFVNAEGDTTQACADVANRAYQEAKKGKTKK